MADADFEALKDDIRAHGVKVPVLTYMGRIVDGRHRWRAAQELGVQCPVEGARLADGQSVVEYVVSLNLHRRSLTASQRAAVAAGMLPMLEEEARERQKRGKAAPPPASSPTLAQEKAKVGKSAAHAAQAVGASRGYVEDAKAIKEESPETFEKVKSGEVTIPEAKRQLRKPPPPAVVKPKDQRGTVITNPAVVSAFADTTLNDLGNRVDALRRDLEAVEGNPHLRTQQAATDLKNVKAAIRFATPYAVCPKHDGKKCRPCLGTGWLPKEVFDRLEK